VPPPGIHLVAHHAHAAGPPVVVVHGAPDRSKNFAKVLHLLGDLPVTAYDRRGYGKSLNALPPSNGFEDQVADLVAILDGRPSVVVGQSAGGLITMMAATRAPELFLAIGVWEPPVTFADWWPPTGDDRMDISQWTMSDPDVLGEQFNRRLLGEDRWDAVADRTKDLLRAEGASFRADLRSQLTPPFDVADLKTPMVVGAGTESDGWMIEGCRRLAHVTSSEYFLVPGADHVAHTHHPDVWAELVRKTVALART
jgi:pimeloyl-ACP methyl ester carboxylesterase